MLFCANPQKSPIQPCAYWEVDKITVITKKRGNASFPFPNTNNLRPTVAPIDVAIVAPTYFYLHSQVIHPDGHKGDQNLFFDSSAFSWPHFERPSMRYQYLVHTMKGERSLRPCVFSRPDPGFSYGYFAGSEVFFRLSPLALRQAFAVG